MSSPVKIQCKNALTDDIFIASDISPPGEDLLPHEPVIYRLFDKFKEAPLIGLEYIVEIIHGPNVDPTYENLLTKTSLDSKDVISSLISAEHRLKYLVRFTEIGRGYGRKQDFPNKLPSISSL